MSELIQPEQVRAMDAWRRFAVRIGGISLGVTSVANGPTLAPDLDISEFLIADRVCDLEFVVAFGDRFDAEPGELVFDSRGLWKLFRNVDGYCFRFTSAAIGRAVSTRA